MGYPTLIGDTRRNGLFFRSRDALDEPSGHPYHDPLAGALILPLTFAITTFMAGLRHWLPVPLTPFILILLVTAPLGAGVIGGTLGFVALGGAMSALTANSVPLAWILVLIPGFVANSSAILFVGLEEFLAEGRYG